MRSSRAAAGNTRSRDPVARARTTGSLDSLPPPSRPLEQRQLSAARRTWSTAAPPARLPVSPIARSFEFSRPDDVRNLRRADVDEADLDPPVGFLPDLRWIIDTRQLIARRQHDGVLLDA